MKSYSILNIKLKEIQRMSKGICFSYLEAPAFLGEQWETLGSIRHETGNQRKKLLQICDEIQL